MSSLRYVLREHARLNFALGEIVEQYREWVAIAMFMILTKWNKDKHRNDVFAAKCAKRGNDVYRSRVERRFRDLLGHLENTFFFNPRDRGKKTTKALVFTLTYDIKRCPYAEAWVNIGVEFNRFMSYLRRKYGKISCCRVFEAFQNGHPHIHCIIIFEEHTFSVFRDSKGQLRIRGKEIIAQGWHSHIDIRAMSSVAGSMSYLKKYLLKGIDAEKADSKSLKTLALCWIYRKRAFSVSGQFRKALTDLISNMHNSNKKPVQITLLGEIIPEERYYCIGFVPAEVVLIEENVWFTILNSKQTGLVSKWLKEKNSYF